MIAGPPSVPPSSLWRNHVWTMLDCARVSPPAYVSELVLKARELMMVDTSPLMPDPVIEAYKKDVDITLLRENLKLTPEARILKLMELQRLADELRRAGREARQRK